MLENRLAIVEDDESLALVTKRALEKRHFNVDHFPDIESAKSAFATESYDYALLDLKVGQDTSLQLIENILLKNNTTKIVLLTGYASIATAVNAIKLGAKDYLTKPASIDQIIQAFEASDNKSLRASASDEKQGAGETDEEGFSLKRLEWENIQRVLTENNGNISATARQLKMHRRTLQRKLDKRPSKQ